MKRSLLLICSFLAFNYVYAQKNPVAGFIVTNEGDTIKGSFDLRSNVSNGKECQFLPKKAITPLVHAGICL